MIEWLKSDNAAFAWTPVALWASLILFFSVLPYGAAIPITVGNFDKMVHFFEYAVLAPLVLRALYRSGRIFNGKIVLFTLILIAVYGILMELIQHFVPGRAPSLSDAASDFAGTVFGLILWKTTLWRK